jgi:hypothetical protein
VPDFMEGGEFFRQDGSERGGRGEERGNGKLSGPPPSFALSGERKDHEPRGQTDRVFGVWPMIAACLRLSRGFQKVDRVR